MVQGQDFVTSILVNLEILAKIGVFHFSIFCRLRFYWLIQTFFRIFVSKGFLMPGKNQYLTKYWSVFKKQTTAGKPELILPSEFPSKASDEIERSEIPSEVSDAIERSEIHCN